MINDILNGITSAIYASFGNTYEIYTTKIEQGLTEPCFFVRCLKPTNEIYLGWRRKLTHTFTIQYFPSTADIYEECSEVFEQLIDCLEYITVGNDTIRGCNFDYTITDGVLTFTIDYDLFAYKHDEEITMDTLDTTSLINE